MAAALATRGDWDTDTRGGPTAWGPGGKRAAIPKARREARRPRPSCLQNRREHDSRGVSPRTLTRNGKSATAAAARRSGRRGCGRSPGCDSAVAARNPPAPAPSARPPAPGEPGEASASLSFPFPLPFGPACCIAQSGQFKTLVRAGRIPDQCTLLTSPKGVVKMTDWLVPDTPRGHQPRWEGSTMGSGSNMRPGARDSCVLCLPPELIHLSRLGRRRIGPWGPEGEARARWVSHTRAVCASAENGAAGSVWGTRATPQMRDPASEDDSLALRPRANDSVSFPLSFT